MMTLHGIRRADVEIDPSCCRAEESLAVSACVLITGLRLASRALKNPPKDPFAVLCLAIPIFCITLHRICICDVSVGNRKLCVYESWERRMLGG